MPRNGGLLSGVWLIIVVALALNTYETVLYEPKLEFNTRNKV